LRERDAEPIIKNGTEDNVSRVTKRRVVNSQVLSTWCKRVDEPSSVQRIRERIRGERTGAALAISHTPLAGGLHLLDRVLAGLVLELLEVFIGNLFQ
jgi:hypothetical protein